MKKYRFTKYEDNYPKLFEKEKEKISKIIPNAIIEHIGSTSVKGLGGKGIIDILICVSKKDIESSKKKLIDSNYILSETGGCVNRIFLYKDYGLIKKRRVHIALTHINSNIHKDTIKFRDSLRKNAKLREEYSAIKEKAILLGKENKDYRNFKTDFIQGVLKK